MNSWFSTARLTGITTTLVDTRTPEQKAQDDVALGAASLNMRLLRNNRGAFKNEYGNLVRFGLGNESAKDKDFLSSDLIGGTQVVITPEMVGKTVFIMTAVECKPAGFKMRQFKPGTRERGQLNFLEWIVSMGGFGGFATCKADLQAIHQHFMDWLKK